MYLVYSSLALVEIGVLAVSAIGLVFLILRGVFRALFKPKEEKSAVLSDSLQSLKRAGAGQSG